MGAAAGGPPHRVVVAERRAWGARPVRLVVEELENDVVEGQLVGVDLRHHLRQEILPHILPGRVFRAALERAVEDPGGDDRRRRAADLDRALHDVLFAVLDARRGLEGGAELSTGPTVAGHLVEDADGRGRQELGVRRVRPSEHGDDVTAEALGGDIGRHVRLLGRLGRAERHVSGATAALGADADRRATAVGGEGAGATGLLVLEEQV